MVETRAMRAYRILGNTWNQVESSNDVLVNILSQLSVESLQSCKTVSKYWHESISNKAFTDMHLRKSRETLVYIACLQVDKDVVLYLMEPGKVKTCRHLVSIPVNGNTGCLDMVCSFNGLICCISDPSEEEEGKYCPLFPELIIHIFNPATGDSLLLPQGTPSLYKEPCIGIGYGPDISQYNVFRIYCVGKKEPRKYIEVEEEEQDLDGQRDLDGSTEKYRYECEMYSSGTRSWTYLGQVPRIPMRVFDSRHVSRHVFLGGEIYWLVASEDNETPGSVLRMDMEGNYKLFHLPYHGMQIRDEDGISVNTHLISFKGSVCLVLIHPFEVEVWSAKEEKWELDHEILHEFPQEDDVITFVTEYGNTLLFMTEDHWYMYDFGVGRWEIKRPCVNFHYPVVFPYTESLLPCNGGVNVGGR